MPVQFIASGTQSVGDNASVSPGLPTGRANGDLLFLVASARGNGTLAAPAGWTTLGGWAHPSSGINQISIYWRIVNGTETTPTVTYTGGSAGHSVVSHVSCLRGVDPVDPWVQIGTLSSWSSQSDLGPITGLTILDGNMVLVVGHKADDWSSVGTLSGNSLTWGEAAEPDTSVGDDAGHVVGYATNDTGGSVAITDKTFTPVGGLQNTGIGFMIEVGFPASAPPAVLGPADPVPAATTTFAERLAADAQNLRLAVLIAGIPFAFTEQTTTPSAVLDGRVNFPGLRKVEQAQSRLDLVKLRMIGGGLTVEIQDDDAGRLERLFAARSFRTTWTTENIDLTEVSIDFDDITGFASALSLQTIYIGGETIRYNSTSGNTINSSTRGAFGSTAALHFGGTENGAGAYVVPPSWIGRKVELIGYFVERDGSMFAGASSVLGTFFIEEAPAAGGDGVWKLQCGQFVDRVAAARVGEGIYDVEFDDDQVRFGINLSNDFFFVVGAQHIRQFILGAVPTHVLVEWQSGRFSAFRLLSTDGVDTIGVSSTDVLSPAGINTDAVIATATQNSGPGVVTSSTKIKRMRHVFLGNLGQASETVLALFCSRLGNGANGSSDDLPGDLRQGFEDGSWGFGAGFLASLVDTVALFDVADGTPWQWPVFEPTALADVLADFCLRTESIWMTDRTGRITFRKLGNDEADPSLELDASFAEDKSPIASSYAEDRIYPRVQVECAHDPLTDKFLGKVNMYDAEMVSRYPLRTDTLKIKMRSVWPSVLRTDAGFQRIPVFTTTVIDLAGFIRRVQRANGRGDVTFTLKAPLSAYALELGQVTRVTNAVSDYEGNASITGERCRVIGLKPDYDAATCDVELLVLDGAFWISPSVTVTSYTAASLSLTLNDLDFVMGNATVPPARMFASGWDIICWAVGQAPFTTRIASITNDTNIVITTTPGFTPQWITLAGDSSVNTSGENLPGFTWADFTWQLPNNGASVFPSRWI